MASFNKVILIGNMTADPELKQTTGGVSVCSFSIAVNRRFAKADQAQQNVDFINIVTWRQQAEFVSRYFKKGNPILICGQLQTRSWTDQQQQKRYSTEVLADEAYFVDSNGQGGNGFVNQDSFEQSAPQFATAPAANTQFEDMSNDDDLPF